VVVRADAAGEVSAATYRRRRLAAVALITLVVTVVLLLAARVGAADADLDGPAPAPSVYVVQHGDTLWSIAAEVAPDVDRRDVVAQLADAAGGDALVPGQRIELPRYFD
jgi:nucleoid-associated protein YgaU